MVARGAAQCVWPGPPPSIDAGLPPSNPEGTDPPEDEQIDGCTCDMDGGRPGPWSLLLTLGALVARPRRRR